MQFNTTHLPLSELASALVFYWVVPWAGAIRFTTAVSYQRGMSSPTRPNP